MAGGHARHWFEPIADHLGEAYLRYSFTLGTGAEVDGLLDLAGLQPGARILDVGCGPGRHALELARRGFRVHGVDISRRFVDLAREAAQSEGLDGATFEVADARSLDLAHRFELVLSLCQGAFGLSGGPTAPSPGSAPGPGPGPGSGDLEADPVESRTGPSLASELDEPILAGMARAAVPGGLVVVSAFSAYFQMRFQEDHDRFDAGLGVNEEPTTVRNVEGESRNVRLWTTCYTPRELRLLARAVGLEPEAVHGVAPGRYRPVPPGTDHTEFLLVARLPLRPAR